MEVCAGIKRNISEIEYMCVNERWNDEAARSKNSEGR